MQLAEVTRGDYMVAETGGARRPMGGSLYLLQTTPIGAASDQPETAGGITLDRRDSCVSEVWWMKPGAGITVALFATCINDTMFPNTPRAVVTVLERLGCTVKFPASQTCCGQMLTNTGYFADAMPSVRNFVRAFGDQEYIVGPSGSCVGAVRHQHPMLAGEAGDAGLKAESEAVAARTYDFSEFLVDILGVTDVGAYFPHRVTYHPTCHSVRVAKVGDRPLRLLSPAAWA